MNIKITISVIIWFISLPILFLQFITVIGIIVDLYAQLLSIPILSIGSLKGFAVLFSLILGLFAWIVLFVMNKGWLTQRPVSLYWPLFGTIFALAGMTMALGNKLFFFAVSPEIIFACFLCIWHVRNSPRTLRRAQ
jgi:hypothetical protein